MRDPGYPSSWSPDGRHLAFTRDGDIWIANVENGKAAVEPLARTPDIELWPEFSPDGRWLAYGSNASGRNEVYVQPYPGPGPRQQVSLEGGESPAWSPTGRELFFVSAPDSEGMRQMMVTDVRPGPALTFGKPRRLFGFSPPALELRLCSQPLLRRGTRRGALLRPAEAADRAPGAGHAHPAHPELDGGAEGPRPAGPPR